MTDGQAVVAGVLADLRGTNAKTVTIDSLSHGPVVSFPREVQIGFDIG